MRTHQVRNDRKSRKVLPSIRRDRWSGLKGRRRNALAAAALITGLLDRFSLKGQTSRWAK
jgi:hypothetical protein